MTTLNLIPFWPKLNESVDYAQEQKWAQNKDNSVIEAIMAERSCLFLRRFLFKSQESCVIATW